MMCQTIQCQLIIGTTVNSRLFDTVEATKDLILARAYAKVSLFVWESLVIRYNDTKIEFCATES
jgi:hypothetical protein